MSIIDIKELKVYNDKIIFLTDKDGAKYSHFIDKKWDGWEKNLKVGNNISVFVRDNGKYKNIYPDITQQNPIQDEDL